jgi:hypothetical protein
LLLEKLRELLIQRGSEPRLPGVSPSVDLCTSYLLNVVGLMAQSCDHVKCSVCYLMYRGLRMADIFGTWDV